ncbi:MAG TPA: glucuronate isomerase [Chthoniobacterales bacterium]
MSDAFISPDFLLDNDTARSLFHEVAEHLPIIDYHCHLPPREIAENRRFANLQEIWLEGDHYKWRALRANGVPEQLITGDAPPLEKYHAWARTLPETWRNPLFHWSQLELARYFGINDLLDETNADAVWEEANRQLNGPNFSIAGILNKFQVEVIGTTDDPTDTLEWHRAIRAAGANTKVVPTFRPDRGMAVAADGVAWNAWVDQLAAVSERTISDFTDFLAALRQRHDVFGELGCRLSDHGLSYCPTGIASDEELATLFREARAGRQLTAHEAEPLATRILLEVGRWNCEKGWTMQLHLGALRNNSGRQLQAIGRDSGYDSIGDWPQTERLGWFLNALDLDGQLPKTILYNLNPADNYAFAAMAANFNEGPALGKVQFGSGWWFLDQKEAIEWQLNTISNLGLLSRFVGMTTDSRSFLSYPRHEYFRRILCNLLGRDVEAGLIPRQSKRLERLVRGICHDNAEAFFGF